MLQSEPKMSKQQPDILVFMSDQHTARLLSCAGDKIVETPHLDALAEAGTRFNAAVTSCPLCVPARCSFMTAKMPSTTGVYSNGNVMPSHVATVAHSLGAAGYETILCGRMHFSGQDQRHGFERRIMGDFTPCIAGRGGAKRDDLGPYVETPSWNWAKHYGAGDSPVLAYDRAVIAAALEELSKPHDRPLFLVVGTYGPHHTFVAPPHLFEKYYERVDQPISPDDVAMHSVDRKRILEDDRLNPESIRCLRAAYYGLIEHTDDLVGQVKTAWDNHAQKNNREEVFMYTSDHGEQGGNRGLWGKMTFFEDAVAIPLIVSGNGVVKNNVVETPVSMVDIPTTITELAESPALPDSDGRSFVPALLGQTLEDVPVYSDIAHSGKVGRMIRFKNWKYWNFDKTEEGILFDHSNDKAETVDVSEQYPKELLELKSTLFNLWDPDAIKAALKERHQHEKIFDEWGWNTNVEEPDRWVIPESAWELPKLPESIASS